MAYKEPHLNVPIPTAVLDRIDERAGQRGISRKRLIGHVLDRWLNETKTMTPEQAEQVINQIVLPAGASIVYDGHYPFTEFTSIDGEFPRFVIDSCAEHREQISAAIEREMPSHYSVVYTNTTLTDSGGQ